MANAFKEAALSFYSGHFYGDLARFGRGIRVRLILLQALILSLMILLSLLFANGYSAGEKAIAMFAAQANTLPAVTIGKNGLSIDKPSPYKITLGDEPDSPALIIDPPYKLGDIDALEKYMRDNHIAVLITADKVATLDMHNYRQKDPIGGELRISDLKPTQESYTFTHEDWQKLAAKIQYWGMSLMASFMLLFSWIAFFIMGLFFTLLTSFVVLFVGMLLKAGIEFDAAMRLAAAFRIPVTVLSMLPMFVGRPAITGLAGWGLWALYLIFAVLAVRLYGRAKVQ